MTDDIVAILRSERNNCRCNAYYSGECCCDAKWAEDYVIFAADEIERLRAERDRWRKIADDFYEAGSNFVSHSEVADDYEEARRD